MSLLAIAAGTAGLVVELDAELALAAEERRLDPGQIESLKIAHADLLALRRLTDVLGLPSENPAAEIPGGSGSGRAGGG